MSQPLDPLELNREKVVGSTFSCETSENISGSDANIFQAMNNHECSKHNSSSKTEKQKENQKVIQD